ncbi:hypothetical protein [Arthrobacter sp. UYCu712]|uniref:hypothetical protein n=1 Tax=Arthrobacter sp. UYCu712 TaxID=3156340 RepID=UPI0033960E84
MTVVLAACVPPAVAPSPSSSTLAERSPQSSSAPAKSAPATSAPTGSAAATPNPTAKPTESASDNWETYTTADGQFMFDYPAVWTIKDRAAEATPGGIFVEVLNRDGKSMATLQTNTATSAACAEKYPYSLLDLEPLPALAHGGAVPNFLFEGRSNPNATDQSKMDTLEYGITSAPEPTGPSACPISHFFAWPPSGAVFGGVYSPFQMPPGYPPNTDTPEAYTETDEYQDVKAVIVSLRPAEK